MIVVIESMGDNGRLTTRLNKASQSFTSTKSRTTHQIVEALSRTMFGDADLSYDLGATKVLQTRNNNTVQVFAQNAKGYWADVTNASEEELTSFLTGALVVVRSINQIINPRLHDTEFLEHVVSHHFK